MFPKTVSILAMVATSASNVIAQGTSYVPSQKNPSGTEYVAVFITADFCVGSKQPGMVEAIEKMKVLLRDRAVSSQAQFAASGVSLDWDVSTGVTHLKKFGEWDDINAGRNWFNKSAVDFIWRLPNGLPSTPQVLLLARSVKATSRGDTISPDTVIGRLVGSDEIIQWVKDGAPYDRWTARRASKPPNH